LTLGIGSNADGSSSFNNSAVWPLAVLLRTLIDRNDLSLWTEERLVREAGQIDLLPRDKAPLGDLVFPNSHFDDLKVKHPG